MGAYKAPELATSFWDEIGWQSQMIYQPDFLDGDETYAIVFYILCRARGIKVPDDLYIESYAYQASVYHGYEVQNDISGFLAERDKLKKDIKVAKNGKAWMIIDPSLKQYQMSAALVVPRILDKELKEQPLTKDEMELLSLLAKTEIGKFQAKVLTLLAEDIRTTMEGKYRLLADQLATLSYSGRITTLKDELVRFNNELEGLANKANEYSQKIRQATAELYGYEFALGKAQEHNEELEEFLRKTEGKISVKIENGTTYVTIYDYLKFSNSDRFISDFGRTMPAQVKEVMQNIVSPKPRFQIRTASAYQIYDNQAVMVDRNAVKNIDKDKMVLANPHHSHFGCMGGNAPLIGDTLRRGDWVQTLLALKTATQNANCRDVSVMRSLVNDLTSRANTHPFIQDKTTGECLTIVQACEVLKSN